jgi:hypothetical protein
VGGGGVGFQPKKGKFMKYFYNEYRVALLVTVTNILADILTARKYVLSQHNKFRENPIKKHKIFDFFIRVMYNNLIKILHVEYHWWEITFIRTHGVINYILCTTTNWARGNI